MVRVCVVAGALLVLLACVSVATAQAVGVTFSADAQTYVLGGPAAQVTVKGLNACAGSSVRIAFTRDSPEPLVGVVDAPVAGDGTASASVPPPLVAGDYVLVAFDAAAPAMPCVPGGSAISAQHFTIVHDVPALPPVIPPPALPPGVSSTLNKLTPYTSPADQAVVWTVSGLTSCRGDVNGHLVDENGQVLQVSAVANVGAEGSAVFVFPLTAIPPGSYYGYLGEACSGLVMTSTVVTIAPVGSAATPSAPSTGSGGAATGPSLSERVLMAGVAALLIAAVLGAVGAGKGEVGRL